MARVASASFFARTASSVVCFFCFSAGGFFAMKRAMRSGLTSSSEPMLSGAKR